ncbi:uncharacterized calcium-binding protein At1g02270-like isoform X2 [Andrographis paniculata]|uniref:uncharacterized calcium-binding protein At1g02270-like isoform X2 n=1 Tax=Andrographis paniculata TaxID=175694 RepID=UPI0021E91C58|nr:uncharacterized calcium-binding protein At1g02270-like isoform X2 [Andrographis paniculata]
MGRKNKRLEDYVDRRLPRLGSYAIASSARDPTCVSCTTFNILAPIYKRINQQDPQHRESDIKEVWMKRNKRILDWLLSERSAIICLQEFWLGNAELVSIYDKRLGTAGYYTFKLARTNNRGDGLFTAVHKDYFRIISHKGLLFNDFADRVAQLVHVELIAPFRENNNNINVGQQILIVNIHLLFPHDSSYSLERLRQVYKILHYLESYQKENKLNPLPVLLCGDLNGSKKGHVYKFLRSQGFISSYDTAHLYADTDAQKWVSHRNHRGDNCGVDFILLLNPNRYRRLLKTPWSEALFGMLKYQLRRVSLSEDDAFALLKAGSNGDCINYLGFCEALRRLNLIGPYHGLRVDEMRELWIQADMDGKGFIDYKIFKRIWNSKSEVVQGDHKVNNNNNHTHNSNSNEVRRQWHNSSNNGTAEQSIGFSVKAAVLFPAEVEKGKWPEDYVLSDHARLTVVFSPLKMPSFSSSSS